MEKEGTIFVGDGHGVSANASFIPISFICIIKRD